MPQVCSSQAVARPSAVKSAGHTPGREHADIVPAGRLSELPGMSDRRHIGAARAEGDRSGGMADQNAGRLQTLLTNGLRHRDVLQPDGSLYGENVAIKYRQLADELNSKHRGHDRQPERAPPPAGEEAGDPEQTLRGRDARERVRRQQEARCRIADCDRVFGEQRQAHVGTTARAA